MKERIAVSFFFVCFFISRGNAEDVRSFIDSASEDHPRLFMKRGQEDALRRKVESDPTLRKALGYVVETSNGMLDLPPVKREQLGRRILSVSRTCLKRVTHLAMAHRLTGDKRYVARAQEEMLAAAAFSDWNPSHFLDVAEMTTALAIGYDWLYEDLSLEARQVIKKAIIEKGLKVSLAGGWWIEAHNNWNQVCHGGLSLGALAVMEDEPELAAQIINRAVKNLPKAMAQYVPDGAYPEGPSYWKYGTTYNVLLLAALESALETDLGLSKEAFMSTGEYFLHTEGPTGLSFNYSDNGLRTGVSPAMYWFAAKREDPSLLWREKQNLALFLADTHAPDGGSERFFPLLFLWAEAFENIPAPEGRHWQGDGPTPVAMHRTGWKTKDEIFVGVKGGSPFTSHAHMDIGSFVMDARGVRWAVDLVRQSYHGLESKGIKLWHKGQDSTRWDVFRLNNFSHNTLVVDGKKQLVSGNAPIVAFSDQGPMPHTIVDMHPVYKDQLAAAKRGVGLWKDQAVLVQDEIEALDRKTSVRWGMVTEAEVSMRDKRSAILQQDGQRLFLRVLSPPDASLELFETATPPMAHDERNEGTRMIGFKVQLLPSAKARLVVLLQPDSEEGGQPAIQPLSEWKTNE